MVLSVTGRLAGMCKKTGCKLTELDPDQHGVSGEMKTGVELSVMPTVCVRGGQVHSGGSTRLDPALLDGTSRPKQREHCRLQQQEMLAARRSHETDETRRQSVSFSVCLCFWLITLYCRCMASSLRSMSKTSRSALLVVKTEAPFLTVQLPVTGHLMNSGT